MKLCDIRDNPGAMHKSKALGRGVGSGKGKTSGRGGKGQTARSGVRLKGFQGGQMPLSRRMPKRGFTNSFRLHYGEINLDQLQTAVDEGKISKDVVITQDLLKQANFFKKKFDGVRILGRGTLTHALNFEVSGVSQSARAQIQESGGSIRII